MKTPLEVVQTLLSDPTNIKLASPPSSAGLGSREPGAVLVAPTLLLWKLS
jgi:hypothetical protein